MMKKRGQIDLPTGTVIEIIIVALVVAMMLFRVSQEGSSDMFEKKFLAKDTAMFIDAAYASPNQLVVRYPQKTYDYNFLFKNSRSVVYSSGESENVGEPYPFAEDAALPLKEKSILNNLEVTTTDAKVKKEGVPIIFVRRIGELEPFKGILLGDDVR